MLNRVKSNPLLIAGYYSPPEQLEAYGPIPELIEQDGFRPDIHDSSEGSVPLSDLFDEMTYLLSTPTKTSADRRSELHRPEIDRYPGWDEALVRPVVNGPNFRIVLSVGFRQRE